MKILCYTNAVANKSLKGLERETGMRSGGEQREKDYV